MLLLRDAYDAEARKRIIYSAADILTFTPTHSALRTSLNFSVRPHAYNARLHSKILDLVFVISNSFHPFDASIECTQCMYIYFTLLLLKNLLMGVSI